ncbi:MAG: hypothetical protein AB1427_12280 [Thermodesulfobacteriota bacterium]
MIRMQSVSDSFLASWPNVERFMLWPLEPQQRAHFPKPAAGLASEYKKILTVEDSLQLAAGFFNL